MALLIVYEILRYGLFFLKEAEWYEWISSFIFLIAESFALAQAFYFLFDSLNSLEFSKIPVPPMEHEVSWYDYPPVAVVLCSYKEPIEVVEQGLVCMHNLTYPNKQLYMLDDSPYQKPWTSETAIENYRAKIESLCKTCGINLFRHKWRGAKAGVLNDFLKWHDQKPVEGSTLIFNQKYMPFTQAKYLIVLDVDQNPLPNLIENLVQFMEKNPKQSFLQTPQYYTNIDYPIANATGMQHIIFFECIGKGKSKNNVMFSMGTNLIYRMDALRDIDYFDESCVTEDIATSFNLQMKGWDTSFLDKTFCFGEGPENLKSFFSQQARWANGTIAIALRVIRSIFTKTKQMPLIRWYEYFMSGTIYIYNAVFFILFYIPILYMFFNLKSYFFQNSLFLLVYLPFFPCFFICYFLYLKRKGYRFKELCIPMVLFPISSPMSFAATVQGLLGHQSSFIVTAKGKRAEDPYGVFELWPQLSALMLCIASVVWGYLRWVNHEDMTFLAFLINSLWMTLFFSMIIPVYYYNTAHLEVEYGL